MDVLAKIPDGEALLARAATSKLGDTVMPVW